MRDHSTILDDFTNVWFVSVMGTGISSTVLYNFPLPAHCLRVCGLVMFAITCFLFIFTTALFIAKYIRKRSLDFLRDPKEAAFLGCYPMGHITIVNMLALITEGKDNWIWFIYVMWWMNLAMTLFTAWVVSFVLISRAEIEPKHGVNATLLLPVVPLTVCSSSGSLLVPLLPSSLRTLTLVVSFLLWCNALLQAFPIISVYFWKLYLYKLPPRALMFSSFIPIGIMGQASYGIMLHAHNFETLLQRGHFPFFQQQSFLGPVAEFCASLTCLSLVSLGYFFTFIAVATTVFYGKNAFNKTWWAMTFPMGTMSLAHHQLFDMTSWTVFQVMAAIYGIALVLVTVTCLIGSVIWEVPYKFQEDKVVEDKVA